jgi:hypothetical protein
MRKRYLGIYATTALAMLSLLASSLLAQQPRSRPASTATPVNNLKIKYKTSTAGQSSESTTMIRGARERSEMKLGGAMEIISITQCDLKRTVQLSDSARKYVVTPMDTGDASSSAGANAPAAGSPSTRGGVVTYTTTSIDTGERRDMFGFKARHVKTTTTIQSSPDACSPTNQRIERDGWYIDFSYGLKCDISREQMMGGQYAPGGCRDRYQFKQVGTGRDGYPLIETTTMYGPDGQVMFTSSKEVVELSREPLDPSLFDVPAGYTETTNTQELYMPAMPSTGSSMDQPSSSSQQVPDQYAAKAATETSEPGKIRVGVVQLNNRSGRQVSTDALRERLISNIQDSGVEAIPLNALTPADAEAEAKAKRCDFILYTDIAVLKASKLGGMFGRVAGVSGAGKTESKIEFKLFAVSDRSPRLQSATSAKEEGDEASAGLAIDQEASMVKAEALKGKR